MAECGLEFKVHDSQIYFQSYDKESTPQAYHTDIDLKQTGTDTSETNRRTKGKRKQAINRIKLEKPTQGKVQNGHEKKRQFKITLLNITHKEFKRQNFSELTTFTASFGMPHLPGTYPVGAEVG